AFLRLRDDKRPEECVLEGSHAPEEAAPEESAAADGATSSADDAGAPPNEARSRATGRRAPPKEGVRLGNLGKIFWPEDGYTKGDLLSFYRDVSPWLLPYLSDRPLVLTRFPDG